MNMESAKNAGWVPDDIPPFISGVAFLVGLRFVIFRGGGVAEKTLKEAPTYFWVVLAQWLEYPLILQSKVAIISKPSI